MKLIIAALNISRVKPFKKCLGLGALFLMLSASTVQAQGVGVRTVYSSTNVGTTNWVVLVAQTTDTVSQIVVADTSGQTLEIGTAAFGASANTEVRQFLIPPGGVSVKIQIPSNKRISIRAVSASATSGENDLNVLY